MAQYHIVSGDGLAESLGKCGISGEIIVCRECLVEGPLDGDSLEDFLNTRAAFISGAYGESSAGYQEKVAAEFDKIKRIPADSEVNLWFGNDLFCQANMWFVMSLLDGKGDVFRVFPVSGIDFGSDDCDVLEESLKNKARLSTDDLDLGLKLWKAYISGDLEKLGDVSKTDSSAFPLLRESCRAHIERFGDDPRPQRVLREIISGGKSDFNEIFQEFGRREAIYGFGDSQVKRLLSQPGTPSSY